MTTPVGITSAVVESELGIHRFSGGLANETYKVDSQAGPRVLKVYHPKKQANAEKEATVLMALRDYVRVPEVEVWGDAIVPGRTALLMEYLPYLNASEIWQLLTQSFYVNAAEMLGRLHSAGQSLTLQTVLVEWSRRHLATERTGPFDQYYCGTQKWLQVFEREGMTMTPLLVVLSQRMRHHEKYFAKAKCSFIHGDYTLTNLLTDGTHVVAVIDPEKAQIGDPSYDVHYFGQIIVDHGAPNSAANIFLKTYDQTVGLPPYFEERRNFYRYYRAFQRTFRYRNDMLLKRPADDSQEKLTRFLTSLVEYSDPWLSSRKMGVL